MDVPNAAPRKRCAIYCRKSTTMGLEQDFNSLDAQQDACERFIGGHQHLGWEVVPTRYHDGGFTGANIDRPAFQCLLRDVEAHNLDVIVTYKLDRISRSLLDFTKLMELFERHNVALVSITQNFCTTDSMGKLTLNILMAFAQYEREMIADRTRDKIAASRRRGMWTGGIVPFGYDRKDKKLVINPVEAVVVQDIFSRYIAVRSPIAVTRFLNFHHRLTKRHRSKTNRVREGHRWDKSDVLRILHNPVYAGLTTYQGERYPGEHQGIVDLSTFDAAQAFLKDRGKLYHETGRNPDYLLRGVLRCKSCGAPFTAASTSKRGHVYRYYRCMTRDKMGKDACPSRQIAAPKIEKAVIEIIGQKLSNLHVAREVTLEIRARMNEERESLTLEKGELPKLVRRLSDDVRRMASVLSEVQGNARSALEAKIEETVAQIKTHERRLLEVEDNLTTLERQAINVEFVDSCLRDFAGIWKALSSANKARLVRTLIERIEIDGATGEYRIVLTDLAKEIAA